MLGPPVELLLARLLFVHELEGRGADGRHELRTGLILRQRVEVLPQEHLGLFCDLHVSFLVSGKSRESCAPSTDQSRMSAPRRLPTRERHLELKVGLVAVDAAGLAANVGEGQERSQRVRPMAAVPSSSRGPL